MVRSMFMLVKKLGLSLFLIFFFAGIFRAQSFEMKSATVAGFINKGKANQDNVNIIMTKSLTTFLAKISKKITPYNEVEKISRETKFWEQKTLKSNLAVQIAQGFSSEQVITGDYMVDEKNDTLSIEVFAYNVITGQLLFQRNYKGNAGPDIFDTIDKMVLDVSGLLAGKPIELGYARITVGQDKVNYKLFVNDGFVKLINGKDGYMDKYIAGQSVDIVLKTEQSDKEVLKKTLEIRSGKTNSLEYNPAGSLILETIEGGLDIYMNGTNIGKTDSAGELKIPNVEAGKQNEISVKSAGSDLSSTNITISEGDLKVIVFKTTLNENKMPGEEKQTHTGKPSWDQRPWYQHFTLGISSEYKGGNLNDNSSFFKSLGSLANVGGHPINDGGYPCIDANLLYRLFDFLAFGLFESFPLGTPSELDFETTSAGGLIRIIPFSFLSWDSESMLYLDLKGGVAFLGGPFNETGIKDSSGIYNIWTDNPSPYYAVALGGLWGLGPVQLGVSGGFEYCRIDHINYQGDSSLTKLYSNIILDNSCLFFQMNLNINF